MARLSIYLLGPFHVLRDGSPVIGFESDKARALLAYLALEADRPQPRAYLAGLLWPDYPEQDARHSLRQALSNLRHSIADVDATPPYLQITRDTIQYNRQSDCWLDVHALDALVDACQGHAHRRLDPCPPCIERLHQAVALYRGSFLQGFAPGAGLVFQEWMLLQEECYRRRVAGTLSQLARCHAWRGEHELVLRYARRHVALEPWREEAHRHIMRALALSGQRNAALLQYQCCRRVLADELGVEPEEETVALYRQVRDGADLASLTGLHNLPAPLSPLIGRELELTEIESRLCEPGCRLLALIGPGGAGKTRLALEVARDLAFAGPARAFRDGIYFVPLPASPSVEAKIRAVAEALGLCGSTADRVQGQSSARIALTRQQLLEALRRQRLLLILDGLECLPAGDGFLADLLGAARQAKLLVTSRTRLGLVEEQDYLVAALPLPGGDGGAPYPGIEAA